MDFGRKGDSDWLMEMDKAIARKDELLRRIAKHLDTHGFNNPSELVLFEAIIEELSNGQ